MQVAERLLRGCQGLGASAAHLPEVGPLQSSQFSFESHTLQVNAESFVEDIAPARTFGFLHEVEMLRQQGLARHTAFAKRVLEDADAWKLVELAPEPAAVFSPAAVTAKA
jgi:UDP-3-O-acyl-N-acetylglucosamine deacetylase